MRASRFSTYGGPEVLQNERVDEPIPKDNQALVRVERCGVNPIDKTTMAGRFEGSLHLPHIPGSEIVGTVEALGPSVSEPTPGTRVAISFRLFCGQCRFCLEGDETACSRRLPDSPPLQLVGVATEGGYAELIAVEAKNLVPVPEGLDLDQAACAALDGATAWHMLERARVHSGDRVMVVGAAGGVGVFCVQIAAHRGAEVYAVSSSEIKGDALLELGAQFSIDRRRHPFGRRARELSKGEGMDVVIDPLGSATFEQSISALGPRGRYVTCGVLTGSPVDLDIGKLYVHQHEIIGSTNARRQDLATVLAEMAAGRLKCPIYRSFPLEQAADALRALDDGDRLGKILLSICKPLAVPRPLGD